MATLTRGYSFGSTETVTNTKLHNLVDDGSCTGIVDADIAAGAAIDGSKIDFSGSTSVVGITGTQTISGDKTFSGSTLFTGTAEFDAATTFDGTTDFNGASTFDGNMDINGDMDIDGNMDVDGNFVLGTANQGDVYYDNGTTMTRLTPGTSGYYLQTQGAAANPVWASVTTSANPAGTILAYGGATAPADYLLCYGQAVSRETYSTLFGIIAEAFGVGDGSTTFNVPDLRGRMPLGKDNMGGVSADRVTEAEADTIGAAEGDQNGVGAHTHSITSSSPASAAPPNEVPQITGISTMQVLDTTNSAGTTGGNIPPYQTVNYIIKT